MKKLFRMIIFSGIAILLTSLWNKGFVIKPDWMVYLKAALIIVAIYYLVVPVSKLILLPLNIITLGFVSVAFYALVLYFFLSRYQLIEINEWVFNGYEISQLTNIFLSAISISTIINLLEKII